MFKRLLASLAILLLCAAPALAQQAKTFAVLPFGVHGPQEYQYLSQGIQSMLTSRLTWPDNFSPLDAGAVRKGAATLPADAFDCFICTQTFDCIFAVQQAVQGAHRLLRPGGVLLATLSGLGQISRYDLERWGEYWRFTTASAARLFEPVFTGGVEVGSCGNLPAAIAALQGLAVEDLPDPALLDVHDADYPLVVTVAACKA